MKAKMLGRFTSISLACVGLAGTLAGCKKEEPPPPLPTAAPVQTAPAPLVLKVEDAGVKLPPDAGVKKPKTGTGGGGSSLKACCNALAQNANLQPTPETKNAMQYAAAACNAAAAGGASLGSAMGVIQAALRGAGLPAGCK
jgi:hypothetical protein